MDPPHLLKTALFMRRRALKAAADRQARAHACRKIIPRTAHTYTHTHALWHGVLHTVARTAHDGRAAKRSARAAAPWHGRAVAPQFRQLVDVLAVAEAHIGLCEINVLSSAPVKDLARVACVLVKNPFLVNH